MLSPDFITLMTHIYDVIDHFVPSTWFLFHDVEIWWVEGKGGGWETYKNMLDNYFTKSHMFNL